MTDILSQGPIFIIALVFLLGVVVVIHELGHYWAGRFYGVAVESFSVGFGAPIWERKDRNGTRWRINWIPLGGFVKFIDKDRAAEVGDGAPKGVAFTSIGPGPRSVVAVAGPLANFVLAVLIFAGVFLAQGKDLVRISIVSVQPGGAAAEAGLQAGDVIRRIDGRVVDEVREFLVPIQLGAGRELNVEVDRDGETVGLTVTPRRETSQNGLGQRVKMGMIKVQPALERLETKRYGLIDGLVEGVRETAYITSVTANMLGRMATGKEPLSNLSGPVGIGDTGRRVVNASLEPSHIDLGDRLISLAVSMLSICALVSIGVGFFNLLPLPVLDGGHLVFNAYEALAGKAAPEKVQEASLTFGLIVLVGMALFVTWGDVLETGLLGQ